MMCREKMTKKKQETATLFADSRITVIIMKQRDLDLMILNVLQKERF